MAELALNLAISVASILGLWILVFWLYADLAVDRFRQEIFTLRDELFDLAATGPLQFEDPVYGLLRSTMNGFIRFAHRIGLGRVLITPLIVAPLQVENEPTFSERYSRATAESSAEARDAADGILLRMNIAIVRYVFTRSPVVFMTIVGPVAFAIFARISLRRLLGSLRGPIERLDNEAFAQGR